MTHAFASPGLTVPDAFCVNEGGGGRVIHIQRAVIRVEPPLGKSRTFSVHEAARLIVHRPKGRSFENLLLDAQGKTLCSFARMEKNGAVFLQYLLDQGVPFYHPDGQPLEIVHPAGTVPSLRFTLQLRRTIPVGMWIGLGFGLGLVLLLAGVPVTAMASSAHIERNLTIVLGMALLSIAAPWVCAVGTGQLFPPFLTVDGEQVWVYRGLGRRELPLEEMDCCRLQHSDECYVLYDKRGRPVIKFSPREDFAPQWMKFLTSHKIKLCSDQGA